MKPFDLEKALAGEPVVTRSGRDAGQFHRFDAPDDISTIYGVVNGMVFNWDNSGRFNTIGESPYDLFMKSKKVVKWVVIWPVSQHCIIYDSEEEAKIADSSDNCIGRKAHRIEWEE